MAEPHADEAAERAAAGGGQILLELEEQERGLLDPDPEVVAQRVEVSGRPEIELAATDVDVAAAVEAEVVVEPGIERGRQVGRDVGLHAVGRIPLEGLRA